MGGEHPHPEFFFTTNIEIILDLFTSMGVAHLIIGKVRAKPFYWARARVPPSPLF